MSSSNRKLWLPVLRPHERARLVRIHEEVAANWSRALAGYLQGDAQFSFVGLGFETFSELTERDQGNSRSAAFFIANGPPVAGFILINSAMTTYLVDSRLSVPDSTSPNEARSLTRLESALAKEAITHLLRTLGRVYEAAGLGRLKSTRLGERLKNTLLFAPDVCLVTFRFRIDREPGLELFVAAAIDLVNPLRDLVVTTQRNSAAVERVVATLPLEVEVELGTWDVGIAELAKLRPGDTIVLPDGQDAWLRAGGVGVKRVNVQISEGRLVIEAREHQTDVQ